MTSKEIILVKLGGSAITDKNARKKPDTSNLTQLSIELKKFLDSNTTSLILSHGQGSYAHHPAKKYGIKNGLVQEESYFGLGLTRKECLELNGIVLDHLLSKKIPATTISPHAIMTARNDKLSSIFLDSVESCLIHSIIPVLHGDVIMDKKKGSTIFSGESVLNFIALNLRKKPKIIIEVAKTKGVYDQLGNTIPIINKLNYPKIIKDITTTDSVDVTGGMLHKVQEAYQLATKHHIPTLIVSSDKGNLLNALLGNTSVGTLIT